MEMDLIWFMSPDGADDVPAVVAAPDGVGREKDLDLPEFLAFRQRQALRGDRQWEVPFLLARAFLTETMAVLDCSTGTTYLPERMAELYPNVACRRFDPLQGGTFTKPVGLPDAAFDRVFCIGTLSKLTAAEQKSLLEELTAKLKPGGLLLLTWPYYFAEEAAQVSGYHDVDVAQLAAMATGGEATLKAILPAAAVPDRETAGLFWVEEPLDHLVMGAVYQRLAASDMPKGPKVVLGLLTWNSQGTSMDALKALVVEARMLSRLGCEEVSVVVCDNGSDDGTNAEESEGGTAKRLDEFVDAQAALHTAGSDPVTVTLLSQTANLGSAKGRNKLIDFAVNTKKADYLLLCDADVEIVPFSVFGMLRYLESYGRWLGAVGLDYKAGVGQRDKSAAAVLSLSGLKLDRTGGRAPVHYGLFRVSALKAGVGLEETASMGSPGWGFEDIDLACQMADKGYAVHIAGGLAYLHRNQHHSIYLLRARGVDVEAAFEARRTQIITKWNYPAGNFRLNLLKSERLPE